MKTSTVSRLALRLGVVVVLVSLCVGRAETQNKDLDPTYGSVKLRAGFVPDPYVKKLVAGGEIRTNARSTAMIRSNQRCRRASQGSRISSRKRCGRKPVVTNRLNRPNAALTSS